jgi:cytochrome c biogenesis protein
MATPTDQAPAATVPPTRNSPWWIAQLARVWRDLTSMRVALVLLFLLALAALPGALLPQRSLNAAKVDAYIAEYPTWGPLLNRLGFFEVFASPWFAAIYLLLFVSLVGCLVPRSIEQARALGAAPPVTPRNLSRLPHHGRETLDAGVDEVLGRARGRLRGWRMVQRDEPGGVRTLSAEKGFLHEGGNLVFHLALVGLLVGIALGKLFGYEGQVIVLSGGGQFCNTGILG